MLSNCALTKISSANSQDFLNFPSHTKLHQAEGHLPPSGASTLYATLPGPRSGLLLGPSLAVLTRRQPRPETLPLLDQATPPLLAQTTPPLPAETPLPTLTATLANTSTSTSTSNTRILVFVMLIKESLYM